MGSLPSDRYGAVMTNDVSQLEEDLTRNALAFLRRAVGQVRRAGSDGQQLAFAVVDLAISAEVLLKARLAREHWTLILDNVNKADRGSLMNGESKTITPEQAVDRLVGIALLPLKRGDSKGGKSHATQVTELIRLRNRAAHFNFQGVDPVSIRGVLGVGLNFMLWFLEDQFQDGAGPEFDGVRQAVDELVTDVAGEIGKIDELVQARLASLADELATADVLLECPRCTQSTLMIGEDVGLARCPFCRAVGSDGPAIAGDYVEAVLGLSLYELFKDGGEWPVYECFNCCEEALVDGIQPVRRDAPTGEAHAAESAPRFACFACGYLRQAGDLMRCDRCGRLGEWPTCPDCWQALLVD